LVGGEVRSTPALVIVYSKGRFFFLGGDVTNKGSINLAHNFRIFKRLLKEPGD